MSDLRSDPPLQKVLPPSELEVHAIVGDFEAGIQYLAMFVAVFVEDGVGVVHVDQDAAALGALWKLLQEAAWT